MKIGILETGHPPEHLKAFGTYPEMFQRLLGDAYAYETYSAPSGGLPGRADACDAYIVTGAPAGVYDPLPWIAPLKGFLQSAKGKAALVGVCFGHQVMAEAFGGKVEKSERGRGVGLHTYTVVKREPWIDTAKAISLSASHQDQIVVLPPAAEVVAKNDFSPFGMVAYTDQPAISIQLHPEFERAFSTRLVEDRCDADLTAAQTQAALESLKRPDDRARVAEWIRAFLALRG